MNILSFRKKGGLKAVVTVILIGLSLFLYVAAGSSEKRSFNWSMVLLDVKTGTPVSFSAPVQSSAGEKFCLIIKTDADCFCYVVVENSGGDVLDVLLAGPLSKDEPWNSPDLKIVDPSGSDSLYVITSREEQKTLAQRISALKDAPSAAQRRAVMNEIFRLRSDVSRFKETPEKPILMGGVGRTTAEGVQFSGLDAYVKTISIEH